MQISSFPYLAGNWDQARAVYGPGGAVREVVAAASALIPRAAVSPRLTLLEA